MLRVLVGGHDQNWVWSGQKWPLCPRGLKHVPSPMNYNFHNIENLIGQWVRHYKNHGIRATCYTAYICALLVRSAAFSITWRNEFCKEDRTIVSRRYTYDVSSKVSCICIYHLIVPQICRNILERFSVDLKSNSSLSSQLRYN